MPKAKKGSGKGKVKKTIVEKAIERGIDFVKVAADQTCLESLIPKGMPSKEMGFKIFLEKGTVYNPPERTGIYGKIVRVGYGARVNGPIFGRDSISLSSGGTIDRGSGLIYGSVTSRGEVTIRPPEAVLDDFAEKSLVIVGDIMAESVSIEAPTEIRGNIIADRNITTTEKTIVTGNVYSKMGSVRLEKTSLYSVVAGNILEEDLLEGDLPDEYPEETNVPEGAEPQSSSYGLDIGEGVSVLNPILWVKGQGKPCARIGSDVRIIGSACTECASGFGFEGDDGLDFAFRCPIFMQGGCQNFVGLTKDDILEYQDGVIITNSWRTSRESSLEYDRIQESVTRNFEKRKSEQHYLDLFETDEISRYASFDDQPTTITHVTNVTQEIIKGDKVIGDKVDIRDSVLMRSQIGGSKEDGKKGGKGSKKISDSVVIGAEDDELGENVENAVIIKKRSRKSDRSGSKK